MVKSYRDLKVWQKAIDLSLAIYKLTEKFPQSEIYGLTSQLRRASVSIASNIAEGYGRGSRGEYKQFLTIARGSNYELQTQLTISRQLGFANATVHDKVEDISEEVSKMLITLVRKL